MHPDQVRLRLYLILFAVLLLTGSLGFTLFEHLDRELLIRCRGGLRVEAIV